MPRLPISGQDEGVWGDLLNEFLSVEHNSDGTLKTSGSLSDKADDSDVVHLQGAEILSGTKTFTAPPVIPVPTAAAHAATKQYVDDTAGSIPDATTTDKGKVRLAGDLGGPGTTASSPVISNDAITSAKLAAGAVDAAALADNAISDVHIANNADIAKTKLAPLDITNADIAPGAAIAKNKLAPLTIEDADVAANAAIAQSKIANLSNDLAAKEPVIPAGTTGQYLRGDKSWHTLDKTAVGLANVDNTSDAAKPISTATATALSGKTDKSTLTTKGDIYVATGSAAIARLPIGGIGQVLTASHSGETGLTWEYDDRFISITVSDEITPITTGTNKISIRAPFGFTLVAIPRASLTTASSSGEVAVDVKANGSSLLGTAKLTIDENEKTSVTASTAPQLANNLILDDTEITIDITSAGTGATGLKVILYYRKAYSFVSPGSTFQYLGGTTYEYPVAVTHINEIPYANFAPLPNSFYLRYKIKVGAGNTTITASCLKDATHSKIAQSCFTMAGQALSGQNISASYNGFPSNDDNDILFMDGQKKAYIGTDNNTTLGTAVLRDFTITNNNTIVPGVGAVKPQGYTEQSWANATVIAFPITGKTLYLRNSQLYVNGHTPVSTAAGFSSYVASNTWQNRVINISDGINSFVTVVSGTNYWYTEIDLTNGTIRTQEQFSSSLGVVGRTNNTEEDVVGDQLFSLDGSMSYYKNLRWYYGGGSYMENVSENLRTSAQVGTISTQTGLDILTTITSDNYAVFADWGHDDGGLYNYGTDSQLGWAKTNIRFLGDNPIL